MFYCYQEHAFELKSNTAVIMKVMDPMRAMASLELMSTRGLETSDQGPRMLSDSVSCHLSKKSLMISSASIAVWQ